MLRDSFVCLKVPYDTVLVGGTQRAAMVYTTLGLARWDRCFWYRWTIGASNGNNPFRMLAGPLVLVGVFWSEGFNRFTQVFMLAPARQVGGL